MLRLEVCEEVSCDNGPDRHGDAIPVLLDPALSFPYIESSYEFSSISA